MGGGDKMGGYDEVGGDEMCGDDEMGGDDGWAVIWAVMRWTAMIRRIQMFWMSVISLWGNTPVKGLSTCSLSIVAVILYLFSIRIGVHAAILLPPLTINGIYPQAHHQSLILTPQYTRRRFLHSFV